jgi:HSP20 family molecular chaperone IbpA
MAKPRVSLFDDFERVVDEFFDDLLIERWRCGVLSDQFERAEVIDHRDRYEVRLAAREINPAELEVEVHDRRLTVRLPMPAGGKIESSFRFNDAVDSEHVVAHWSAGLLTITLPKQKGRRVELKHS